MYMQSNRGRQLLPRQMHVLLVECVHHVVLCPVTLHVVMTLSFQCLPPMPHLARMQFYQAAGRSTAHPAQQHSTCRSWGKISIYTHSEHHHCLPHCFAHPARCATVCTHSREDRNQPSWHLVNSVQSAGCPTMHSIHSRARQSNRPSSIALTEALCSAHQVHASRPKLTCQPCHLFNRGHLPHAI